jgi:formate hydrogenlyase subunit 3/multisubunit Na+/H+ antiporter MnhD subunit
VNPIEWGLATIAGLTVVAVLAALAAPQRSRVAAAGIVTAVLGGAGVVVGLLAAAGHRGGAWLPELLPLFGVRLEVDPLGGVFTAVAGAVTVAAAVYGIGYTRRGLDSRTVQAALPLFVAAMLLLPAAASVATFLLLWEAMAAASLLLVLAEHRRRTEVAEAGLWYAVMTHAGMVTILLGLLLFGAEAGGETFAQLRAAEMSPAARSTVFLLTLVGFASKAGAVPLHVWLPKAHPEAPSHASALMSAAMVNLGVYGILRVDFDLLGGGPTWWWLLVLAAGAVSALYGILQAAVATDLKRLLGYSTTENLGLILLGVGAAGMFATAGNRALAGLALAAALLHVVNHAGFKTLLFLAAGSVQHATGTRDLDALGGMQGRMPATTGLFAVGALAAAALPPGNGFISEWLLLQSLIHALPATAVSTAVTMPLAVAVIALTAGLGVATFVKALGVGFFAKARTPAAEKATEAGPAMLAGMGLAAAACVGLALTPTWLVPGLARAVAVAVPGTGSATTGRLTLQLSGITGSMSPLLIAAALAVAAAGTLAALRVFGAQRARRAARLWDCGGGGLTARTEYTATSFAEPLQRVFDDVLRPEQDIDVTHVQESRYLVDTIQYRRRVPDRIEHRLYAPILAAIRAWGEAGRRLATGSVHRYLGYGFYGVITLLVALAVTR